MALSTLVVSCDPAVLQKIIPVFDLAGIITEVCTRAEDAERKLAGQRYDATLIDCASLPGAREVLDGVRRSGTNRSSVTIAIVSEITSPREAAMLGASFVLEKSFTQEWLLRSLRAAQGLMVVENRRYYRHPVDLVAWVQRPGDRSGEVPISIYDISQGGIGAHSALGFAPQSLVELRLTLPDGSTIDAQAEVVWMREGRLGLQFTRMSSKSRSRLVAWLMAEYDRTQPPLPPMPTSLGAAGLESHAPRGRKLLCHAFAQNLPIAWKCGDCGWRYSIRLEDTRWRYANEPPQEVVLAFDGHDCAQHPRNGAVFGK